MKTDTVAPAQQESNAARLAHGKPRPGATHGQAAQGFAALLAQLDTQTSSNTVDPAQAATTAKAATDDDAATLAERGNEPAAAQTPQTPATPHAVKADDPATLALLAQFVGLSTPNGTRGADASTASREAATATVVSALAPGQPEATLTASDTAANHPEGRDTSRAARASAPLQDPTLTPDPAPGKPKRAAAAHLGAGLSAGTGASASHGAQTLNNPIHDAVNAANRVAANGSTRTDAIQDRNSQDSATPLPVDQATPVRLKDIDVSNGDAQGDAPGTGAPATAWGETPADGPSQDPTNPASFAQNLNDAMDSLGAQVSYWSSLNVKRATLQFDVGDSKSLAVDVQLDKDEAKITFLTDDDAARDAIRSNALPVLQDMLARNGIDLQGLSLGSHNAPSAGQQGAPQGQAPAWTELRPQGTRSAENLTQSPTLQPLTPRSENASGIDVFV